MFIKQLSQKIGLYFLVWRFAIRINRLVGFDSVPHIPSLGDNNGDFLKLMKTIQSRTLHTQDKCYFLARCLKHSMALAGEIAECGIYKGGTAYLLASLLEGQNKALHLFDTFTGIPESSQWDTTQIGDFSNTSFESVRAFLKPFDFVVFHVGRIPGTFRNLNDSNFCFVHVDVDTYQTTRYCCEFFYSRMVTGGIILFDDYLLAGARKAIDEFFFDLPEEPLPLRSGQCIVVKHTKA